MVSDTRYLATVTFMKVSTSKVKSRAKVSTSGNQANNTRGSGQMATRKAMAYGQG